MISRRTFLISTVAGVVAPWRWVPAPEPDLVVLHTNDLHGRVDVEGAKQGLIYLADEIRRVRRQYAHTLLLDAGDIIHGTPMEWLHGPTPVMQALNSLKYDAATVGNHEFDFGPDNLRLADRIAEFPLLSANVCDANGNPWGPLKPYVVKDVAGKRVGILGLTTEGTVDIQWPRTIENIRFTDAEAAARKYVAELRPKVDLLIALSHLGYKEDRQLAHEAPGIDLIVGGHSHTRLETATIENGVPIVQTGAHGKALGRLDIRFDGKQPQVSYRLIDAAKCGDKDSGVDSVYRSDEAKLNAELSDRLAVLEHALPIDGIAKEATPLGKFLAAAVQKMQKTDVGLFSSSQIGKGFEVGPVLRRTVYDAMGSYTRQHLVRCAVPTPLLREALAKVSKPGAVPVQQAWPAPTDRSTHTVAGPAHVIQDLFLDKPGVKILFDDPRGPNVRDAVIEGFRSGLHQEFAPLTLHRGR